MCLSRDLVPLLQVRALTVKYSGERSFISALQEVHFEISPGEIVGILGESGSGKSTLALSILGLLPANARVEGSIVYRGENLLRVKESHLNTIRGAKIAMIGQEPGLGLNPVMRVGDQIAEVLRAHRPAPARARKLECEAILREVMLADVKRISWAYPHQLSGGELLRVALAQALVCQPELVIADEATRSLDVTVQTEIVRVFAEIKRKLGSAFIFITHNPALLAGFADRVVVMYAGRIVEEGAIGPVFHHPLHPYTKGLLQLGYLQHTDLATARRLPVIPGTLSDQDFLSAGCIFEPRCSARTSACRLESPEEEEPELGRRVSCFNHGN
jgi:peptide/nickel transport system ATP-binding protein